MEDLIQGIIKIIGGIMLLILASGLASCQSQFFQMVTNR